MNFDWKLVGIGGAVICAVGAWLGMWGATDFIFAAAVGGAILWFVYECWKQNKKYTLSGM